MCNCRHCQGQSQEMELVPEFESILHNEYESLYQKSNNSIKVYPNRSFGYVFSIPKTSVSKELNEIESEVYDPDRRKAIVDTLKSPYRWICRLELYFNDPANPGNHIMGVGTGTLISPKHILTVGHNLLSNDLGEVVKIKATPGYNCAGKIASPFGFSYQSKINYHDKWKTHFNNEYDYGLITLNSEIGKKTFSLLGGRPLGYWGDKVYGENTRIIPQTIPVLKDKPFNISGYPGDKCCFLQLDRTHDRPQRLEDCKNLLKRFKGNPSQMVGGAQFSSFGKVTNPSPAGASRLILYDLDTWRGHSGSPLWIRWQQYRNLIAIHTGDHPPSENRGIRITEEVMKQVQAWM